MYLFVCILVVWNISAKFSSTDNVKFPQVSVILSKKKTYIFKINRKLIYFSQDTVLKSCFQCYLVNDKKEYHLMSTDTS